MCIPLHAYLVGQSHRIGPFEEALRHIASCAGDVWFATGSEIARHYRDTFWDGAIADIKRRGLASGGTGFDHGLA